MPAVEAFAPSVVGFLSVLGIIVLALHGGEQNTTLNSIAGLFAAWAFGSGAYHTIVKPYQKTSSDISTIAAAKAADVSRKQIDQAGDIAAKAAEKLTVKDETVNTVNTPVQPLPRKDQPK